MEKLYCSSHGGRHCWQHQAIDRVTVLQYGLASDAHIQVTDREMSKWVDAIVCEDDIMDAYNVDNCNRLQVKQTMIARVVSLHKKSVNVLLRLSN
jgi:hypothetical protein